MALAMRSYRQSMWRLTPMSPLTRGYVSLARNRQALNRVSGPTSLLFGFLRLGRLARVGRRRGHCAPPLTYASRPADLPAQVVEASLAHVAMAQHVDLVDTRRVDHEGPLDSDPVRDPPHSEVLAK